MVMKRKRRTRKTRRGGQRRRRTHRWLPLWRSIQAPSSTSNHMSSAAKRDGQPSRRELQRPARGEGAQRRRWRPSVRGWVERTQPKFAFRAQGRQELLPVLAGRSAAPNCQARSPLSKNSQSGIAAHRLCRRLFVSHPLISAYPSARSDRKRGLAKLWLDDGPLRSCGTRVGRQLQHCRALAIAQARD